MTSLSALVGTALALSVAGVVAAQQANLVDLSLEELTEVRVISVSRGPERVGDAAASIYVITSEDIRRAGATSLGEALRLAPNLQVARIDSVQYAISARGFNNAIGNKLLVLIDGRTVYTPLFSGVFWDQQDVLLSDVERIEVISGPGATLWGANAVNGVINVITRAARDTQGLLVGAGAGDLTQDGSIRYGGAGANGEFRVYAKATHLDNTVRESGVALGDEWSRGQVGFRADWDYGEDEITIQGDIYRGRSEDRGTVVGIAFGRIEVGGGNVLGRWTRRLRGGSELKIQSYFDHAERDDMLFFRPEADIFDVDVQHSISKGAHNVVWGGGYRDSSDEIGSAFVTTFIPASRDLDWENVFAQDRIPLTDRLEATVGLKLERNSYTGTESLPSARLAWKPTDTRLVWSALSRAVRAPARYDRDVFFPGTPPFFVIGGPNFVSEVADVLELGYRAQPAINVSFSLTAFYHDWDKVRSGSAIPVQLENRIEGGVRGLESWVAWRVRENWRLSGGFTVLDKGLRLEPGSTDPVGVNNETLANDADHQWVLRSSFDLRGNLELDASVRHVASLPKPAVPDYTAVDARLSWRLSEKLELAATVQNLFDARHPEFGPATARSDLPRSVFIQAQLRL
jgi:iron complex outermembrane recepter protein